MKNSPQPTVPANAPGRFNRELDGEIHEAIGEVLQSGWYVLGPQVELFEREFAEYCGTAVCVGVGNGTDALELALRAVGVGPGSEVITVANAGMYATTAILAVGARPRFIDVDEETMNLEPAALEAALGNRTRAVIATHLYGRLAPMEEILAAVRGRVPVIEDCAQAHGAEEAGRKAGSWGAAGCFSFYPTKNLGGVGDGGAVVTSDAELAERLRPLRQYGWQEKYRSVVAGGRNSRLDEVQAAVLRCKLRHLDRVNKERRELARRYEAELAGTGLRLPAGGGSGYVAHLYVVRSGQRDRLRAALERRGIRADVHYPIPDHRQPCLKQVLAAVPVLPVTERLAGEVLSLPIFPNMTPEEQSHVVASVSQLTS